MRSMKKKVAVLLMLTLVLTDSPVLFAAESVQTPVVYEAVDEVTAEAAEDQEMIEESGGDIDENAGEDSGADVGEDVGKDNGEDAGEDTGKDNGQDAGEDTGKDNGEDAGEDTGKDNGEDAGEDTGKGSGGTVGEDAGKDTSTDSGNVGGNDIGEDRGNDTGKDTENDSTDEEKSLEGVITVSAIKSQTYTGKELKPAVTVKDAATKKTLKINKQYTVSYENNVDAGTAAVVITGISASGYEGVLRVEFQILSRPMKNVAAKTIQKAFYYSGEEQDPDLNLTYNKMTLQKDRDYTVTYENNMNPGNGVITITGIGNYTGIKILKFKIQKQQMKNLDISLSEDSAVWESELAYPEVMVQQRGSSEAAACTEGTDYKVVYPKQLKVGKNTIKVTGLGNYTGTVSKIYTVQKRSLSQAKVICPYIWEYTGKNLKVQPEQVLWGETELIYNKDYTIRYAKESGTKVSSIKTAGNYQLILTGKGNYEGSVSISFCVTGDSDVINNNLNSNVIVPTDGNQFQIESCLAKSADGLTVQISLKTEQNEFLQALAEEYPLYAVRLSSAGNSVEAAAQAEYTKEDDLIITAAFTSEDELCRAESMGQYAVALETEKGKYQVVSDTSFLQNPEIFNELNESYDADKDIYFGYYEKYKISSKKGIQGTDDALTDDLKVQHVLLNLDMSQVIGTEEKEGYKLYNYKGKEYYFKDILGDTIYSLNGWGNNNPYGSHNRSVTVVLLMGWRNELSYLIHPSARRKGAAPYYALNMQDEKARETFEALFHWLGETYGADRKYRVSNWTLGNEVNSCKAWNYSGSMSLGKCVENYAKAFELLYQGIRSSAASPRLFISLDHCWTTADAGHNGKSYLDKFAAYMNEHAPHVQWNVNFHSYSQPLTRSTFWSDTSNTTSSVSTKYISMRNIKVLTDYLSTLEEKYGKENGSIRVILGEHGFSGRLGNAAEERKQAAALGYGYYIAMFNDRIDAYIIRAYQDAPAETKTGLYLGLQGYKSKKWVSKKAYGVYKYIDTDQSLDYMDKYLATVGLKSWESKISGFDASALAADPDY